jgi:hypothetical protein
LQQNFDLEKKRENEKKNKMKVIEKWDTNE